MTTLFAQPYDITATGFYFDSHEDYQEKVKRLRNEHGDPVEEFELQFIDGDEIDSALSQAWDINQCNCSDFLEACDNWHEFQKIIFIIAVGECGYQFDETGNPEDFDVDYYQLDNLKELAEQFVEEGLYGEILEPLQFYIDTESIARDLEADYSETTIAGTRYVYRCA